MSLANNHMFRSWRASPAMYDHHARPFFSTTRGREVLATGQRARRVGDGDGVGRRSSVALGMGGCVRGNILCMVALDGLWVWSACDFFCLCNTVHEQTVIILCTRARFPVPAAVHLSPSVSMAPSSSPWSSPAPKERAKLPPTSGRGLCCGDSKRMHGHLLPGFCRHRCGARRRVQRVVVRTKTQKIRLRGWRGRG